MPLSNALIKVISIHNNLIVNMFYRKYNTNITPQNTVKKLVEEKKLDEAYYEFKKHPTPYDASFIMGRLGYNLKLEQCFEMYEILKQQNNISISLAVSMISTINSKSNSLTTLEYCKDLIILIRKQKNKNKISPITWNFTLKHLGVFIELFESEILFLMEEMLKCNHIPSEGIIILLLNNTPNTLNIVFAKEIINLLTKYEIPISIKYYTIYLKSLILSNRITESIDILHLIQKHYQVDSIFFTIILSTTTQIHDGFEIGKVCHNLISASSKNIMDIQLSNTLISFYNHYSKTEIAYSIFSEMNEKNIVSWNNMLSGFVKNNETNKTIELFNVFLDLNLKPNESTLLIMLNAYASIGNIQATEDFLYSMKERFNIQPNVGHYGCLIKAYLKKNNFDKVFDLMNTVNGIKDNPSINILLLSTCIGLNDRANGMNLLDYILNSHQLNSDVNVMNVLLRMLTKFGEIENALLVFNKFKSQNRSKINVSMWTTLIHGLGINGRGREGIKLFNEMVETTNISPDSVIITSILTTCSHSGLVEEAVNVFKQMTDNYNIKPSEIHYCCMVDVFGRAGLFEEAEHYFSFVKNNLVALMSYLGACRKFNNINKAESVFEIIMSIDEKYAPAYVLLLNIYSSKGLIEKRNHIRYLMEKRGIKKEPGMSVISINNKVHSFVCEDNNHAMKMEIYNELDQLFKEMKQCGFVHDTSLISKDMPNEEKEKLLSRHSEKIAIAFGLLNTPQGTPLTIVNNLRICGDCHEAIKFISKLKNRDIIVTDTNRVHHFRNGTCSCGDYF